MLLVDLTVILFYKYVTVPDVPAAMAWFEPLARRLALTGRLLLSDEGVNGSLAGSPAAIQEFCTETSACPLADFASVDWKHSAAPRGGAPPFLKLVVRRSLEVTMSGKKMSRSKPEGTVHLTPLQFHDAVEALQQRPAAAPPPSSSSSATPPLGWVQPDALTPDNTVLIDVRNAYEVGVGRFEGAFNPEIRCFAQLSSWADENKETLKDKNVLMYCTGGVRCEKASAYIKKMGASRVAQLQGGIHRYLETFPDGGLFKGSNFIFDGRMLQKAPSTAGAVPSSLPPSSPVGRCNYCATPSDAVGSELLCRVCRHFVIVCSPCAEAKRKQATASPTPAAAAILADSDGSRSEEQQQDDGSIQQSAGPEPGGAPPSPFLCGEHRLLSSEETEWRGMLALVPTPLLRAQRASMAASLQFAVRRGGRRLRDRKRALQLKLERVDFVLGERGVPAATVEHNDDEAAQGTPSSGVEGGVDGGFSSKPLVLIPYYSLLNPALSPWG